jgi:hypothetical protein
MTHYYILIKLRNGLSGDNKKAQVLSPLGVVRGITSVSQPPDLPPPTNPPYPAAVLYHSITPPE